MQNRVIPKDWIDFITAILEAGPQLHELTCRRTEEALAIEQHNRTGRVNISKDQLLGEGEYAELQMQILFDDVASVQCLTVGLNAWDKVEQQ